MKRILVTLANHVRTQTQKHLGIAMTALVIFAAVSSYWPHEGHAQGVPPGPKTLQVTIGSGTTQVTTTDFPCRQAIFQNNATHTMRIGDSLTSSSRGAVLLANSVGSMNIGNSPLTGGTNLNGWFVNGTASDVLDVICNQ